MNIAQTQQVLSYIWSTHPSAPKYSDEGKTRIIASYFRILYKYSIDDVLEAVDRVCRESATFIPSAYEIEAKCTKHVDIEAYLSSEYELVLERLEKAEARRREFEPLYDSAFKQRSELLGNKIYSFMSDDEKAALSTKVAPFEAVIAKYIDLLDECQQLKARKEELYNRASWEACDAYDRAQAQMAHNDLCALGYERLALGG